MVAVRELLQTLPPEDAKPVLVPPTGGAWVEVQMTPASGDAHAFLPALVVPMARPLDGGGAASSAATATAGPTAAPLPPPGTTAEQVQQQTMQALVQVALSATLGPGIEAIEPASRATVCVYRLLNGLPNDWMTHIKPLRQQMSQLRAVVKAAQWPHDDVLILIAKLSKSVYHLQLLVRSVRVLSA